MFSMKFFWLLKWCVLLIFVATPARCVPFSDISSEDVLPLHSSAGQVPTNSTCKTLLSLAQAMYDTGDNILKLTRAFYPPQGQGVSFLRVTYDFEDEKGDLDGCSVTYIWAKGGFLVIQPPTIFQMTSLLFNHKVSADLTLTLPFTCRHLINNGSNCFCNPLEADTLDVFTHQLKLYAKYAEASKVVQEDSVSTYAICATELDKDFYGAKKVKKESEVVSFLIITVLIPMVSIILMAMIVRSLYISIHVRINDTNNHHNVAGIVMTGIFVTFYIVGCDSAACYYAWSEDHELNAIVSVNYLNKVSTTLLLAFDGALCLVPIMVLLYISCNHWYSYTSSQDEQISCCNKFFDRFLSCCLRRVFAIFFTIIFGTLKHGNLWENNNEKSMNLRLVWILTLSLVAPLFAISSHITFILVAWLTDTPKASSVALICLAVSLYFFFISRQCYMANVKVNPKSCCWWPFWLSFYPFKQCFRFFKACQYLTFCTECKGCSDRVETDEEIPLLEKMEVKNERFSDSEENTFNTKTFCIMFSWGWILAVSVFLMVFAFFELPIVTFEILSDLLNTFEVFVIVVSLLITYKVLSITEPNTYKFLEKLRATYKRHAAGPNDPVRASVEDERNVNDFEAAGSIMGELAGVIIHKLR